MAIETLPDLPAGVLGFRASGVVTAEDYTSVLHPAIDAAVAAHEKVNLLFVIGDDFERFSAGAIWQDALLEGTPAKNWGRIALVTDNHVLVEGVRMLGFLVPAALELFPLAEAELAATWVADGPKAV